MTIRHRHESRLGIDLGRVIINGDGGRGDTSFFAGTEEDATRTPAVPGALATIAALTAMFERRVWLVSKCGPKVQSRTRRWLRHHDFWRVTGVYETNLRFCLERKDKALHCKQNRISHFIDDRVDVHEHLAGVVERRYLFGPQRAGTRVPAGVIPVLTWADVAREFGLVAEAPAA